MAFSNAPYCDGCLVHDPDQYRYRSEMVEWRNNTPFQESLIISTYARGCSSARFILATEDGRTFPMFMIDMLELLQTKTIREGAVTGAWHVVKRGRNYGLKLHIEKEE